MIRALLIAIFLSLFSHTAWSAERCPELLREALNPKKYEEFNCTDKTMLRIIPESAELFSCMFNKADKQKLKDLREALIKVLTREVLAYCNQHPDGKYNQFADELWSKAESVTAPILDKHFPEN